MTEEEKERKKLPATQKLYEVHEYAILHQKASKIQNNHTKWDVCKILVEKEAEIAQLKRSREIDKGIMDSFAEEVEGLEKEIAELKKEFEFWTCDDKELKKNVNALREELKRLRTLLENGGRCPDCGGLIKIRNPTGKCDHLYYPENKKRD